MNKLQSVQSSALILRPVEVMQVAHSNTNSVDYKNMNDSTQTFYVSDATGNLMKISKDTNFEVSIDHQFHRMDPKLNQQAPGAS